MTLLLTKNHQQFYFKLLLKRRLKMVCSHNGGEQKQPAVWLIWGSSSVTGWHRHNHTNSYEQWKLPLFINLAKIVISGSAEPFKCKQSRLNFYLEVNHATLVTAKFRKFLSKLWRLIIVQALCQSITLCRNYVTSILEWILRETL